MLTKNYVNLQVVDMYFLILRSFIFIFITIISYIFLVKISPFLVKDIPNSRSSHNKPIYRGGGIVFVLVSFLSIPITKFYSLFTLIPLILTSYWDDLFSLSPKIRYVVQLVTVFLILHFNLNLPINNFIIYFFILIIGTAIINFTNFIDGIDGILASNMLIAFLHLSCLNQDYKLYPLMAGILAFLFLNKAPAKLFMGDIGSTFLGAIFFMKIIELSDYRTAFLSLSAVFPIYIDTTICVIARFCNKENIFVSHKKHLYQRLVTSGLSHNKVTIIYSLSSALICLSCYTNNIKIVSIILILIFFIGLLLNYFIASSFIERKN